MAVQKKAASKLQIYISIVAISLVQALQLSLNPVLGDIGAHYAEIDVSLIQLLVTAPSLLSMVFALLSGRLVLRVSKKKLLLFSAVMAAVVGFLPLLADSFWLLLASRALYGVALGITTTMNVAVVADYFTGDERVRAMGFQAASIGAGFVVVTAAAGFLGKFGFRASFFVNALALASLVALALCLPEEPVQAKAGEKVRARLNEKVLAIDLMAAAYVLFLAAYSTNISMHLSGALAGDSSVAGILNAFFSGSQIVIGLLLGVLVGITHHYTIPVAMGSFVVGAALLVLFPSSVVPLAIGSTLCGFCQGIMVPTASTQIANSVSKESTALASATLTCAMNLGMLISPAVLNTLTGAIFGEVTTGRVYTLAAVGMAITAVCSTLWIRFDRARGTE